MKERKIFYKQLTPAELGEAKTHEKYIRFPNDFDYKSFFGIDAVKNESVLQLDIDARYNGNPEDIVPLKFVYYANSNKEKRMPSLGPVFEKYQVKAGSIFALEVISDNGNSVIDVSFKKANELKLFTNPVCYTEIVKDTVSPHADIVIDRKKGRDAVIQDLSKAKTNYSPSALSTFYLTAMRTKPFLLLAGISGTGKSRIVKQMAFESCPDIPALRSDKTAPGNYELIEVKPNWHDSSELLGYESEIGGPHYVVTPFVRFLVKAMRYPDVPFFVCMDETTHQFSRKVIDRAMTIEMNIEDAETPFKNFFEGGDALHYYDNPQPKELFLPKVVQASEALSILSAEDASYLKENVPGLLHSLNSALNGTPFKIAYRVQNELILYFFSLREENPDEAAEALLAQAMDAILMMKVLPRIEGDEDLLDKPLKALAQFTENYPQASRKIAEMQERLPQAHFTCFWP